MSPDLRLCILTPEYASQPPIGGIATYTRASAKWLVQQGHLVHVVCVTRDGEICDQDDEGVQVHFVPPRRIRPRTILRLASILPGLSFLYEAYAGWNLLENSLGAWWSAWGWDRKNQFDLIECCDFGGLGFWGLLSPLQPRILLRGHAYLHLGLPYANWPGRFFHHKLERFCGRRARFVLTASNYLANCYERELGVEPHRVAAWPTGVNAASLQHQAATSSLLLKERAGPTILYVGRIEHQKGCDLLFAALRNVHRQNAVARAVLLGKVSEDARAEYEAFIRESADWCCHLGEVQLADVLSVMMQASVLVLPSRTDTLPRTLIEALFCGLPQVATRVGGIPEIVEDKVTGLLIEPEDPVGLAQAILELCASPEIRTDMGRESRKRAFEKFEMSRVMSKQVQVYRALIEGRSPHEVFAEEPDGR